MKKVGEFMGSGIFEVKKSKIKYPIILDPEQWRVLKNIMESHFKKLLK